MKNVVTLQQEKLLEERANLIDNLQKDVSAFKDLNGKKEEECNEYKSKIDELVKQVEEGKKIIADNTHGIIVLFQLFNYHTFTN